MCLDVAGYFLESNTMSVFPLIHLKNCQTAGDIAEPTRLLPTEYFQLKEFSVSPLILYIA